ncbi:hypothetical protein [uncultured Polaribacter sp.]|uniref:hypothetical protein n=1 Tax=uncultured Polaribacter sp. TaxID=174711 RepID=UPI002639CB66|nr:hypothetical protein [uncultured Polaribacter sp.]
MNYLGNYEENKLYGTLENNKILVATVNNANFLKVELSVVFDAFNWNHNFEIPFFNNEAELYFENYIHSIITQKLEVSEIDVTDFNFTSFDIAAITCVLKEMENNTELDTKTINFSMVLGDVNFVNFSNVVDAGKYFLPIKQSTSTTLKNLLSFSFYATLFPVKVRLEINGVISEINLPSYTSSKKLHTLFIPVEKIIGTNIDSFTLSLVFSDNSVFTFGKFYVLPPEVDHSLLVYQNSYGTLTSIEFTGAKKSPISFKSKENIFIRNNKTSITTNVIEEKSEIYLDTGYIRDESKYDMIINLLKSFNIYELPSLKRLITKTPQKITPLETDNFTQRETLIFKYSENDNIYYRGF